MFNDLKNGESVITGVELIKDENDIVKLEFISNAELDMVQILKILMLGARSAAYEILEESGQKPTADKITKTIMDTFDKMAGVPMDISKAESIH